MAATASRPIVAETRTNRQLVFDFEALEGPPREPCKPMDLSANAREVLEARYLRRDLSGNIIETPNEMLTRVAESVAKAEAVFGGPTAVHRWSTEYLDALTSLYFLPNSPTIMNAGTKLGMLSACFVLPVEDSMDGIFGGLHIGANIHKMGGGTGYSFSRLRPKGDIVRSTRGIASGPISFMQIFDAATEHVKQGGRRRGANMGVLRCDHPNSVEFVDAKRDGHSLQNFNLSIGITDEFMKAAISGKSFPLKNPRTGKVTKVLPAGELWKRIAINAWATGDPGVLFLDTIGGFNPTPALGEIEATNPCGEVPLLPYEACNLASLNLAKMVKTRGESPAIDWDRLARTIRLAIRFLDDAIEVSKWPHPKIEEMVRGNRKVGLGVMGFADLLIQLQIPYASDEAVKLAEKLMQFIRQEAQQASQDLAEERGVFPNWEQSIYKSQSLPLRNATVTSIAPTGTISIIAGASPSIEPLFALAYRRENVLGGQTLTELNPLFVDYAKEHGFYTDRLLRDLRVKGSVADIDGVPDDAKHLFRTALEIAPSDHLAIQAAFQKHCCNAVSKTINLPESATPEDVCDIYRKAFELGLKGVTVYRYGSKSEQVLSLGAADEENEETQCTGGACPRCADG